MVSKGRSLVLFIAAVTLAVALVFVCTGTDSSDAADSSYIRSVSIKVYDQDSTDYSDLAYLSDELPKELSAAEWVRDTGNGLWYNVNTMSPDFGKILRYGMIYDITLAEIRSDVGDYSPIFSAANFVIVEVGCEINGDCTLALDVKKDGTAVLSDVKAASLSVAGYYVSTTTEGVYLYTVDYTQGDIKVADPAGLYSVAAKCNGIAAGNASTDYRGTVYHLSGSVKDKGAKEIANATINYNITDSEGTVMSEGSLLTAADGTYTIDSVGGTIVNVTSVTAPGFTFDTDTYSYGTVTGDVWPGMTFVSNENYIRVIVRDQSGRFAPGVEISAMWYNSYPNGDGTFTIEGSTDGIVIPRSTDDNGTALVTLSVIKTGWKLVIKGLTGSYSFYDVEAIYPTPVSTHDLPDHLDGGGNAYANTVTFTDITITADDYSIEITTKGRIDEYYAGGAVIQGVLVKADWYYQVQDGYEYTIRTKDTLTSGFADLTPGRAWFANAYSGEDGIVLLHYTIPTWTVAGGESAYIYIYASGAGTSSPASEYTFTFNLPSDGNRSVEEIADNYVTCVAMPHTAIFNASVNSDEISYTINGTILGDLPDSVKVYCITPAGIEMSKTVEQYMGTLTFAFTVKAGTSCKVGIEDLPGYTFTPQSQQMPSAYSDLDFVSTCASAPWSVDRGTPSVLTTYTVTGLEVGDVLSMRYSVAGTNLTVQKRADAADMTITITGWSGNVSEGFVISGQDKYIKWISADQIRVSGMTQVTVVTYFNSDANEPTIENVVGAQTIQIYCEDENYATVLTDSSGKATATLPDIPEISYWTSGLAVTSAPVTSGAYVGCTGLNLKDVIPSPGSKFATITVRYIATSSLQNESQPTNVDIISGPVTLTLSVGDTHDFTAPDEEGFIFSGWYINGTNVSNSRDSHVCNLRVTEDMDGATLVASYAAETPAPPKENIGTTVAIGILAVTIAIVAMIFVILQIRRY